MIAPATISETNAGSARKGRLPVANAVASPAFTCRKVTESTLDSLKFSTIAPLT